MTHQDWIIAAATGVLVTSIVLVGGEITKRLDRIAGLLARANEMTSENRTGSWRE